MMALSDVDESVVQHLGDAVNSLKLTIEALKLGTLIADETNNIRAANVREDASHRLLHDLERLEVTFDYVPKALNGSRVEG